MEVEAGLFAVHVDEPGDFARGQAGGAREADEKDAVFGAIALEPVEYLEGVGQLGGVGRADVVVHPRTEAARHGEGVAVVLHDGFGLFLEFGGVALDEDGGFEPIPARLAR